MGIQSAHGSMVQPAREFNMTSVPSAVLPKSVLATDRHKAAAIRVSPLVVESATMDTAGVYAKLNSRADGLTDSEAATRLDISGICGATWG